MTDRELLELTAKAAGMKCRWWKVKQWTENRNSDRSITKFYAGTKDVFGEHHAKPWDPLQDDGDALRLAVKLRLMIDVDQTNVMVLTDMPVTGGVINETTDGALGPTAATRRAIVRAAAEIGKAMP